MLITGNDNYSYVVNTVFDPNEDGLEHGQSFDDVQWVVLAYFKVCDYLRARGKDISSCMQRADLFYQIAASAWDDKTCGGGVWWSGARDYKNAITNELFILTSAEYYLRTGNTTYLNNANKTWKWSNASGMRNAQNLYNDGLVTSTCKNNGQTTWTYNQGVIASGLASLAVANKDPSLFDVAERTINATISTMLNNRILKESCDSATGATKCDVNQQIFKGVFTKHLQYFLDKANDPVRTARFASFWCLALRQASG